MPRYAEARAVARASGLRSSAGELLIDPEFKAAQAAAQALLAGNSIAVYNGNACLGHIVEVDHRAVALTPDGITIGVYRRRQGAFKAISEQQRRP
jgi:hypothetical protein